MILFTKKQFKQHINNKHSARQGEQAD